MRGTTLAAAILATIVPLACSDDEKSADMTTATTTVGTASAQSTTPPDAGPLDFNGDGNPLDDIMSMANKFRG